MPAAMISRVILQIFCADLGVYIQIFIFPALLRFELACSRKARPSGASFGSPTRSSPDLVSGLLASSALYLANSRFVLHICSIVKTATVRDLRNHYMGILKWISSGEIVQITQRGKPIARLVPEPPKTASTVDWAASAAVRRNRSHEKVLSAEESINLIHESGGRW